jgi:ribonuclease VapC
VIVVETSAIIAILQEEPEGSRFLEVIRSERCIVSTVTIYEAAVVINARRGPEGVANLLEFMEVSGLEILPFTVELMTTAIVAYQRFGKGSRSGACLNLGDCATYALAKSYDAPLLFKGDDFTATDIRSAD